MRSWVLALGLVACSNDKDATSDGAPGTGDTSSPTLETSDTGTPPPCSARRRSAPPAPPANLAVPGSQPGNRSSAGAAACDGVSADALSGAITDLTGGPLVGVDVKFCNVQGCRIETTAADGSYCYTDVVPEAYSFVPVPPEGSGLAHALTTFPFASGEVRSLDLVVPVLGPVVPLPATPEELETGDGLYVTVGLADLAAPDPFVPDAECLAGVQVPNAAWPPVDGVPGTPVAVWYVDPYDFDAPAGLPFRIEDQWGSADGAAYELWVASYGDFGWLLVGTLTAGGGWIVPDTGVELPLLSTLVLVDPA